MTENGIEMQHEERFQEKELGPCWVSREPEMATGVDFFKERINDKIFVPGREKALLQEIITLIESAKEQICIASFLISDLELVNVLLKAAERNVDVYLLTASEAKLASEASEDNEFEKMTIEEHKKLLDRIAGKILVRTAQHLHSKFILVDPNGSFPRGFVLTSNLTTEALTRNPEIAVKITGNDVKDLFRQFCTGFWNESERELLEAGKLSIVGNAMRGYVSESFSGARMCCTTNKMSTIQDCILKLVHDTHEELWVCAFGFQQDNNVMKALIDASKQGRKITVIARPRQHTSSRDALLNIVQNGGNVYGLDWLHAKCVIASQNGGYSAVVMTANIEDRGLVTGFETGILLDGKDAETLKELVESWALKAQYGLAEKVKIGNLKGKVKLWDGERLIEKTIEPLYDRNMGTIKAKKGKDINTARPKNFPLPPDSTKLYHVHRYRWRALQAEKENSAQANLS